MNYIALHRIHPIAASHSPHPIPSHRNVAGIAGIAGVTGIAGIAFISSRKGEGGW